MSTSALLLHPQRMLRRRPLSERVEVGITTVLVVIGLVLAGISLLYLFYANEKATQDYHLRILQEKHAELVRANEVVAMLLSQREALVALEGNPKIQKMRDVKNKELLFIRDDIVVARTNK
ncbi:hypothetical protein HZA38_03305 [Candidatus Peregrinibacteria bacterium]|nr:hypothetical protein [Candidatus Peregrinibacteria bacterium]